MRILFVCTGNICRSPTAEGVMRHALGQAGLGGRVDVYSAATHDYHIDEAPDPRTVATAKARGVGLHMLRGSQVSRRDFETYDLILAMDRGHLRILERMRPAGGKAELALFLDYAGYKAQGEVPDPYYGGQDGFDAVYDMVEAACEMLIKKLKRERALASG